MLTWDQWDLNWNVWLNGFLKMSCASKSLQNLESPSGKGKGNSHMDGIVHLGLFTEITQRRMDLCCWWNGKWDLRKQVFSRKQRLRGEGFWISLLLEMATPWSRGEGWGERGEEGGHAMQGYNTQSANDCLTLRHSWEVIWNMSQDHSPRRERDTNLSTSPHLRLKVCSIGCWLPCTSGCVCVGSEGKSTSCHAQCPLGSPRAEG